MQHLFKKLLASRIIMPSGCWEWTAGYFNHGYGRIYDKTKALLVHRVSYACYFGDPGELKVLHRCDNKRCFNPEHLFLGTQDDNMKDCKRKGRNTGGKTYVLTPEQINDVCLLRKKGQSIRSLAIQFDIPYSTMNYLLKRNLK